jgi:hypothetical protein
MILLALSHIKTHAYGVDDLRSIPNPVPGPGHFKQALPGHSGKRRSSPTKNVRNGHNTGFLRMARPNHDGRALPFWGEKVAAAGAESPFVSSGQAFG